MNRMRQFGLTAAVFTAALGLSSLSYATTLDFTTGPEGNYAGGSNGDASWTASATGNAYSRAYLDGANADGPAGMGVCSRTSDTCAGSQDDNTGYPQDSSASGVIEVLSLTFDSISGGDGLTISEMTFNKRLHGALANQTIEIGINGVFDEYTTDAFGALSALNIVLLAGDILSFTHGIVVGDVDATRARDFYLATISYELGGGGGSNPVPVPAALPLFASGVAGLGYLARKRRKAAAKA